MLCCWEIVVIEEFFDGGLYVEGVEECGIYVLDLYVVLCCVCWLYGLVCGVWYGCCEESCFWCF